MLKFVFCSLLFFSVAQGSFAAEIASSVLAQFGASEADFTLLSKTYPELKELRLASSMANSKSRQLKLYAENTDEVYTVTREEGLGGLNVEKSEVYFEMRVKTFNGEIKNTLYETILQETDSERLASEMAEAFKEDFTSTKGLRINASYTFDVLEYYDNDHFVKYGSILTGAVSIGHAVSRRILQMNPDSFTFAFLPENYNLSEKPFYAPVKSSRVSSLFQLNRRHPLTRKHQPHNGVDFVAPGGTAVYPALDGEVVTISRSRSKGKYVTILHDNGYKTTYIHLKRIQKGLRVGDWVNKEDQVGEVGRTGFATGAHLHFGVIKDDYFINPIYLLKNYSYDQKEQYENLDSELENSATGFGEVQSEDAEE